MKAYRCEHCQTLHQERESRCQNCNYSKLKEISLTPKKYCEHFGHDGEERKIPGTQKFEGKTFEALEEDGICIGGSNVSVYSNEYEFKCSRCGFTKRERR